MTLISSISGIRGTVNGTNQTSLTPIDVVKYVSAYGTWINTKKKSSTVVVGRDGRISGKSLLELVKSTLISLGINVIDTGLSTTPTTQIIIKENSNNFFSVDNIKSFKNLKINFDNQKKLKGKGRIAVKSFADVNLVMWWDIDLSNQNPTGEIVIEIPGKGPQIKLEPN